MPAPHPSRRRFLQAAGGTCSFTLLAGCDPVGEVVSRWWSGSGAAAFTPPDGVSLSIQRHLLNRLTWGPRPGDDDRVIAMGPSAFLDQQLDPESIDDRACLRQLASIESLWEAPAEAYERNEYELLRDMSRARIIRATSSRRQLLEVMVDFWTDHLNIVAHKRDCRWLKISDDRLVIRRHALGRFRDLIGASAISPAMLIYLDGHENRVSSPTDRPNENYARELLELHTLGVHGGYSQRDVMEVARCLSGWTYRHKPMAFKPMHVEFVRTRHDDGAKTVLGTTIPAGGGADDLERVLDLVCAHPATARHIATKLCRWFIADPAPESAVNAVAQVFTSSDGDIPTTLRAVFGAPEFMESRGTLFKRPFRFLISALRGLDAKTTAPPAVIEVLERMGQLPYQYPTPDGYPIEPAPWYGTLLWRWNFALDLERGRLPGTRFDRDELNGRAGDARGAVAHLLGRQPSPEETGVLEDSPAPLALALASPAFQYH